MDLGTILGVIIGIVLIIFSILLNGTPFAAYLNFPSLLMVVGGSYGALMVANPIGRVLGMTRYLRHALRTHDFQEAQIVTELVQFSDRARREGLLALEDNIDQVDDEFMRKGLQLIVDGTDPEVIKTVLYTDLTYLEGRHEIGINIFKNWGKLAPAFGLIGTLIGLVAMLNNLEDPSIIGTGLALALLTTMYGAILANLVLIPIQLKLTDRNDIEVRIKEIVIEGILSIQSGDNPRILLEKLLSYLPPNQRETTKQETEFKEQQQLRGA